MRIFIILCFSLVLSLGISLSNHAQCNLDAHLSGYLSSCNLIAWHNTSTIDCPDAAHTIVKLKYGFGATLATDTSQFVFYNWPAPDSVMYYDSIPNFVNTVIENPNCNLIALYISAYDANWNLINSSQAHRNLVMFPIPFLCFGNIVAASGCTTEDGSMLVSVCNPSISNFYQIDIGINDTWTTQFIFDDNIQLNNLPQGEVSVHIYDPNSGCSAFGSHVIPSAVDHLEFDVYGAENLDGIHSSNEPSLEGRTLQIAQLGISGTSDSNGTVAFYNVPSGNHTMSYVDVDGAYTPIPLTQLVSNVGCYSVQLVPSDTLIFDSWRSNSFRNGFVHCVNGLTPSFQLQNRGTATLQATLEFSFDPMFTVTPVNGELPFSNSSAGLVSWDITGQPMSSYQNFACHIEGPGIDHVLESFPFAWHLVVHDELGAVVYDQTWSRDILIVCGYDPNLLSATPIGILDNHYILSGDTIEYHIDFQNTGSALAENIKVVDFLDPTFFYLNSIEVLGASHAFHSTRELDGTLTLYFDHIQLPDSASDEPASHGEFSFRVRTRVDLGVNTVVQNSAAIYFDVNPPVITNTYEHTIFDCWWLNGPPSSYVVCSGTELTFENSNPYATDQQWLINGELMSVENQFSFVPEIAGEYSIQLVPSNELCAGSQITGVVVNESPDVTMEVVGNVIVASGGLYYDWYFNGVLIDGAHEASVVATEDGLYSVDVYNIGCMSSSQLVFTSVENYESKKMIVSPNPANDKATVQLPASFSEVMLYDALGRVITRWLNVANSKEIDTTSLSSGIYLIRVKSDDKEQWLRLEVCH